MGLREGAAEDACGQRGDVALRAAVNALGHTSAADRVYGGRPAPTVPVWMMNSRPDGNFHFVNLFSVWEIRSSVSLYANPSSF